MTSPAVSDGVPDGVNPHAKLDELAFAGGAPLADEPRFTTPTTSSSYRRRSSTSWWRSPVRSGSTRCTRTGTTSTSKSRASTSRSRTAAPRAAGPSRPTTTTRSACVLLDVGELRPGEAPGLAGCGRQGHRGSGWVGEHQPTVPELLPAASTGSAPSGLRRERPRARLLLAISLMSPPRLEQLERAGSPDFHPNRSWWISLEPTGRTISVAGRRRRGILPPRPTHPAPPAAGASRSSPHAAWSAVPNWLPRFTAAGDGCSLFLRPLALGPWRKFEHRRRTCFFHTRVGTLLSERPPPGR